MHEMSRKRTRCSVHAVWNFHCDVSYRVAQRMAVFVCILGGGVAEYYEEKQGYAW